MFGKGAGLVVDGRVRALEPGCWCRCSSVPLPAARFCRRRRKNILVLWNAAYNVFGHLQACAGIFVVFRLCCDCWHACVTYVTCLPSAHSMMRNCWKGSCACVLFHQAFDAVGNLVVYLATSFGTQRCVVTVEIELFRPW